MWETPEVDGALEDKEFAYQGVGINNLDKAVMQGWVPVKASEKVGKNWLEGPNGYRMFGEQVLCKMPKARWLELKKETDDYIENVLTTAKAEERYREEVGEHIAYGGITET